MAKKQRSSTNSEKHYIDSRVFYSPDGCWYWIGNTVESGYGCATFNKHRYRAHRFSYLIFKGQITDGLYVCHTCDNRLCVNPDHLFLGTARDNWQDCLSKKRIDFSYLKKIGGPRCKLNRDQVTEIISTWRDYSADDLAKMYNTNPSTVRAIIRGDRYHEVTNGINLRKKTA